MAVGVAALVVVIAYVRHTVSRLGAGAQKPGRTRVGDAIAGAGHARRARLALRTCVVQTITWQRTALRQTIGARKRAAMAVLIASAVAVTPAAPGTCGNAYAGRHAAR